MATYLMTGVAGFIAARTAEMLLADGHVVVGIDNLSDYYDVRLKDYRLERLLGMKPPCAGTDQQHSAYAQAGRLLTFDARFVFEPVDIEDPAALARLFSEFHFDAVFHLAARAGVRYSVENPCACLATNALGTLNLLECQRKNGVRKHILASTSALYAGCPLPFTEDQPVNTPLSPYAASKKAAEVMAYSYHNLHGLDVSILRYFTVFGPAGRPDMSVFRFIKWIAEGQPIKLHGDGSQARDFTYVDDIARGTMLAAKPLGYEIFNLGGGSLPLTLQALIEFLEQTIGNAATYDHLPIHPTDITKTQACIAKADQLLGWRPQFPVKEGLRRAVEWYFVNRHWLQSIQV
jgi:nucleoside-diphosphate-sugar epimerase